MYPKIVVLPPGPKGRRIINLEEALASPSLLRPYPLVVDSAESCIVRDVDGNEFIDCIVNNGACILGHADKDVEIEVIKAAKNGLTAGMESELSLKVAKQLHDMIPSAEQVRFANSGSEAVMKALMIARAFTNKEKIIKVEGGYHGWFDEVQVSVHPDPALAGHADNPEPVLSTKGIRRNTTDSVLVISFNNLDALEKTLASHKGEVAAILIEPVMFNSGCVLPQPGYLKGVRRLADKFDVVLIFDEVITGCPGNLSAIGLGPFACYANILAHGRCPEGVVVRVSGTVSLRTCYCLVPVDSIGRKCNRKNSCL